jgi:hypothetical protein
MSGLGQQAQVQRGELLKMPDVVEQRSIPRALLVDEAHRRGGWARLTHRMASFQKPFPANGVPNMTDEG